jgi:SAM-dependent methyltransferase
LVAPTGWVVLSDVVPEMAAAAAARAAALCVANVRSATIDLEQIDEGDASFDVVLCREGLMFAVDPDRAAHEIHRVLAPGGRVAIAVWSAREQNPWLGLVFDAVTAETGFPVPPPGVPGPFSLGDRGVVRGLFEGAGFVDITVDEIDVPARAPSFEAWWTRQSALAGPLSSILESMPADVVAALTERLRASIAPYTSPAGAELPGVALLASARRP